MKNEIIERCINFSSFRSISAALLFVVACGCQAQAEKEDAVTENGISSSQDSGSQALMLNADQKQELIQSLMQGKSFILSRSTPEPYPDSDPQFCQTFISQLASGNDITYIEPKFVTDDENDTRFDAIKKANPDLIINQTVMHEANRDFSYVYKAKGPYTLYEVDIDNNPSNGVETILYVEGLVENMSNAMGYSLYHVFESASLKKINGETIQYADRDYNEKHMGSIVEYNDRYYFLKFKYFSKSLTIVHLVSVTGSPKKTKTLCAMNYLAKRNKK